MKKLTLRSLTIFAMIKSISLNKNSIGEGEKPEELGVREMQQGITPNFRFEKINVDKAYSGKQANYYFEFSASMKVMEKINKAQAGDFGIEFKLLFPRNFALWLDSYPRRVYWGLRQPPSGDSNVESEAIVKQGNVDFMQDCNLVDGLEDSDKMLKFDLTRFFANGISFKKNIEKFYFGFLVSGVHNPPKEGYLDQFEAKMIYQPKVENGKDKDYLDMEAKSAHKHGQKIFLRKEMKRVDVLQPFQDFVPGFFTSDFTIMIENGATYPIEVIPYSDDPEIRFEPEVIRFEPLDYLEHSENTSSPEEGKNDQNAKESSSDAIQKQKDSHPFRFLRNQISKTFKIRIGLRAVLGEHKIKFRKRELTVQNLVLLSTGEKESTLEQNYSPIEMLKFNVKNPPKMIASKKPAPFNGEIPTIGFKKRYIGVPFEGISFPTKVEISHPPAEDIKLRIDTIRPFQEKMVEIHDGEFYIQSGDTGTFFYVASKLGAVNGDIVLRVLTKDYKNKLRITDKKKFAKLEITDFETVHPDVNKIEVDGKLVIEDDFYVDLKGYIRDTNEKMIFDKNGKNLRRSDLKKKRKVQMFEELENDEEIEEVLIGDKPTDYFKNELLELEEEYDNEVKFKSKEKTLNPSKKNVEIFLSKRSKVYSVILRFPNHSYPSFEKIGELIEKFCHRTEEQILEFNDLGIIIVKTQAVYKVSGGWNFIAEFNFDEYNLDRNFKHRAIFISEDRSHLKKLIDFKVVIEPKENLNLYQLELFAVSKAFSYDRLIDVLCMLTKEKKEWFKPQKKEKLEDFINRNKLREEERDRRDPGHDMSNCYNEYVVYFFSHSEEQVMKDTMQALQEALAKPETHLLLYNQEPPTKPCKCDLLQQIKIKNFMKIREPLERLQPLLVESKTNALLVNFNHPLKHGYHQFLNFSAVSEIRERFKNKPDNDLDLIHCTNGICQKMYHGLKEMKDYLVRAKGCIRFKDLGYCSHGHSKLKAVTQPMLYVAGKGNHSGIYNLKFVWMLTIFLGVGVNRL